MRITILAALLLTACARSEPADSNAVEASTADEISVEEVSPDIGPVINAVNGADIPAQNLAEGLSGNAFETNTVNTVNTVNTAAPDNAVQPANSAEGNSQ